MIFGQNPASDILLAILGLTRADVGRYRDCYTNDDGTEIIVYTRNGGGNREDYQPVIDELAKHPNYLRDEDDEYDCTYASIVFSVPEPVRDAVKAIADQTNTTPPAQKWQTLLNDLNSGKSNAVVARALEVGKEVFAAVESGISKTVSTPDGSVQIISK